MAHVLVLGGTGKLERVSQFLAEQKNIVSIISRSGNYLPDPAGGNTFEFGSLNPVHLDYFDTEALSNSLQQSLQKYGPVSLALVWAKPGGGRMETTVAEFLNANSPMCRFFHIWEEHNFHGIYHREPLAERLESDFERVLYRKIVLEGGIAPEGDVGQLRDAISDPIISAIRNDEKFTVISSEQSGATQTQTA